MRLFHDLAANLGNGLGQRDVLGTNLDAVLGIAAFLDAAIAHQSCLDKLVAFLMRSSRKLSIGSTP